MPVLEASLHQFPFRILGFHCDNGAEFSNRNVANLLGKQGPVSRKKLKFWNRLFPQGLVV